MPRWPGRSAPSWVRSLSTCSRPRDFFTRSCPSPHTAMPRRVVAPVLQTAQTVQQDGSRFLLAHVSYNSAHILKFLLKSLDSSAHADTQSIRMSHSGHSLSVLRSPAYLPAASRTRSGTGELPPKRSILSPPRCPAGGQALALVMGYSHGLLSLLRLYKNSPGCFYRG